MSARSTRPRCTCGRVHRPPVDPVVWDSACFDALVSFVAERVEACADKRPRREPADRPVRVAKAQANEIRAVLPPRAAGPFNLPCAGLPYLVCDRKTYAAAGERLARILSRRGIGIALRLWDGESDLVPDERTLGELIMHMPERCALIVACGSGVINDLARFASAWTGVPFISVPTAPSMDGYTSSVAPLNMEGVKVTFPAVPPHAVFVRADILNASPRRMKAAGFGDMAGKLIARLDWELARLVTGEPFCSSAWSLVEAPLRDLLAMASRAARRPSGDLYSAATTRRIFEGLANSGLAIVAAGNSRPASGSEHQISHFFEMKALQGSVQHFLHGETVALGTWLMAGMYRDVFASDFESFRGRFLARGPDRVRTGSGDVVRDRPAVLRDAFGGKSRMMIDSWRSSQADEGLRRERLRLLEAGWSGMQDLMASLLPSLNEIEECLRAAAVPYHPRQFGFGAPLIREALICAKEVRPRFTLLHLLDEVGALDAVAEALAPS